MPAPFLYTHPALQMRFFQTCTQKFETIVAVLHRTSGTGYDIAILSFNIDLVALGTRRGCTPPLWKYAGFVRVLQNISAYVLVCVRSLHGSRYITEPNNALVHVSN